MVISKEVLTHVLSNAPQIGKFSYCGGPNKSIFDQSAFLDGLEWVTKATEAEILASQDEAKKMLEDYAFCARNFPNLKISRFAEICEAALEGRIV